VGKQLMILFTVLEIWEIESICVRIQSILTRSTVKIVSDIAGVVMKNAICFKILKNFKNLLLEKGQTNPFVPILQSQWLWKRG